MGVFTRFKRSSEGFRQLVELWESTPSDRRKKMIDIGMQEDPEFTKKAMECMMTFEDILKMNDMEIAELVAKAPPRVVAYAIHGIDEAAQQRFLKNAKPQIMAQIRDGLMANIGPREIGGARLSLVIAARGLEHAGFIQTKKIPL
jgi:flagellar motor switch protein FliG